MHRPNDDLIGKKLNQSGVKLAIVTGSLSLQTNKKKILPPTTSPEKVGPGEEVRPRFPSSSSSSCCLLGTPATAHNVAQRELPTS